MRKTALLFIAFMILATSQAKASEVVLSANPTLIRLNSLGEAQVNSSFQIKNESDNNLTLSSRIYTFEPMENGQVKILFEQKSLSPIIKDRLKLKADSKEIDKLELRPGEKKNIEVEIQTLDSDKHGDYYFSIVFQTEPKTTEKSSYSSLSGGIAVNLMLSLGNENNSELKISDFSTNTLSTSSPQKFTLKVENTGKNLTEATGVIIIRNLFGKEVGRINFEPQYVLSNSSRYLLGKDAKASEIMPFESDIPQSTWEEKFILGLYSAHAEIKNSENGKIFSSDIYFFSMPVKIILAVSLIIFIILGIAVRTRKALLRKRV